MKNKLHLVYHVFITYFLAFIILGFILSSPSDVIYGIKNIIKEPDILITDYIAVGGIGAAFVNAGLVGIIYTLILIYIGIKPNGSTIAALFTILGFSFFGKNIFNIWPILIGVWLYSKYQNEPFLNYSLIALFGSTLSPTINVFYNSNILTFSQQLFIGFFISIFIGFILPPISTYCLKFHQGYSLYNTGFAAGLIATVLMSILRTFGIDFEKRLVWSSGNNYIISILLFTTFIIMIILGYYINNKSFKHIKNIFSQPGRLVSDFYIMYGKGPTYINMGLLGIFFTSYVLLIQGDLNGPTMAGIFTIVGFGAFGKHLKNVLPIIIGTILSIFMNIWHINSPNMILATLFSTTLAPIAGNFGFLWGTISGFLHVCIVMNIGYLHGGLNLYNNGFAGGLVAIFLIPLITAFRKET